MTQTNRQRTESFLFSEVAPQTGQVAEKVGLEPSDAELAKVFPELAIGQDFVQKCLETVKDQHAFGALAVKVDGLENTPEEKAGEKKAQLMERVAGVLEELCQQDNLAWGLLEYGVFGVCLPDSGEPECQSLGRSIQSAIQEQNKATATVGLAVFPTADFRRAEIFDNVLKTLDHAAFFGPGVMVPFDAVTLNISGDKHYHEKDLDGAVREFERALLIDSGNVNVYNSLGVCFAVLGDLAKALDRFDMAAQLDPSEVMPVFNSGLSHLMLGNKDKALDFLQKALEVKPDLFEAKLETGKVLLDLGRISEARTFLDDAVKAQPETWTGHKNLGDCHLEGKEWKLAAKSYEKSVKLNPEEAESLSGLAISYAEMGENLDIAMTFAQKSLELAPKSGLFNYRLAVIMEKRDELPKAALQYEKALALGYPCSESVIQAKEKLKQEQV